MKNHSAFGGILRMPESMPSKTTRSSGCARAPVATSSSRHVSRRYFSPMTSFHFFCEVCVYVCAATIAVVVLPRPISSASTTPPCWRCAIAIVKTASAWCGKSARLHFQERTCCVRSNSESSLRTPPSARKACTSGSSIALSGTATTAPFGPASTLMPGTARSIRSTLSSTSPSVRKQRVQPFWRETFTSPPRELRVRERRNLRRELPAFAGHESSRTDDVHVLGLTERQTDDATHHVARGALRPAAHSNDDLDFDFGRVDRRCVRHWGCPPSRRTTDDGSAGVGEGRQCRAVVRC